MNISRILLKAWLLKKSSRLVVFIDDLDRCSPDQIIQVLEAVKIFVDTPQCVFVFGLDFEIVQKAVAEKYKGDVFAQKEYLSKIIQIPFYLPELNQEKIKTYLETLHPVFPDPRCQAIFMISPSLNLRALKRSINAFSLAWDLTAHDPMASSRVVPLILAKLILLRQYFPELLGEIQKDPGLLKNLESACVYLQETRLKNHLFNLSLLIKTKCDPVKLETVLFDLNLQVLPLPDLAAEALYERYKNDTLSSKMLLLLKQNFPMVDWAQAFKQAQKDEEERNPYPTTGLPRVFLPYIRQPSLIRLFTLFYPDVDACFSDLSEDELEGYLSWLGHVEKID